MGRRTHLELSRREREIMEILYRLGTASVAEVRTAMARAPSYSAVRATLNLLEEKGHSRHHEEGRRYVYSPVVPASRARRSALQSLLETFFDNSVESAVASLLDLNSRNLSDEDLDRLSALIAQARPRRKKDGIPGSSTSR